jgi:hypothetical protein
MSRLRRIVLSLFGAVVIPAVTLVTVATVSVAAPSATKAKPGTPVVHKKPCTAFSGCSAASAVTTRPTLSFERAQSHSRCSHGREKSSTVAKSTKSVAVTSQTSASVTSWTRYP